MKTSKQNQVGNFEKLVSFTNAQGAVYNPGKASIKSAALQTLLTQAQGAIQAAYVSRTAYVNALNARHQSFEPLLKLATRIIGAVQASGISEETLASCKAIKRRFHGKSKKTEPVAVTAPGDPQPETTASRSISQTDYDSMIANFQQLVIMATSDPLYKPNETDLQATALNTLVTTLKDKNKAVSVAKSAMNEANRTVATLLYSPTGIYGQAVAAKNYVKSLYGFQSGKYKEVSNIKFRNA